MSSSSRSSTPEELADSLEKLFDQLEKNIQEDNGLTKSTYEIKEFKEINEKINQVLARFDRLRKIMMMNNFLKVCQIRFNYKEKNNLFKDAQEQGVEMALMGQPLDQVLRHSQYSPMDPEEKNYFSALKIPEFLQKTNDYKTQIYEPITNKYLLKRQLKNNVDIDVPDEFFDKQSPAALASFRDFLENFFSTIWRWLF